MYLSVSVESVSHLVIYAQSTIMAISGRTVESKSTRELTSARKTSHWIIIIITSNSNYRKTKSKTHVSVNWSLFRTLTAYQSRCTSAADLVLFQIVSVFPLCLNCCRPEISFVSHEFVWWCVAEFPSPPPAPWDYRNTRWTNRSALSSCEAVSTGYPTVQCKYKITLLFIINA